MKKLLLLLLITASATAQMKITEGTPAELIGKYRAFGNEYAEISKNHGSYIFVYQDVLTQVYKSFPFSEADFDALYNLFSNFQEGKEVRAELERGDVLVFTYKKSLGKKITQVMHIDNLGITGNMKEIPSLSIDKLFGKAKLKM